MSMQISVGSVSSNGGLRRERLFRLSRKPKINNQKHVKHDRQDRPFKRAKCREQVSNRSQNKPEGYSPQVLAGGRLRRVPHLGTCIEPQRIEEHAADGQDESVEERGLAQALAGADSLCQQRSRERQ